jgi:hypothetical protein
MARMLTGPGHLAHHGSGDHGVSAVSGLVCSVSYHSNTLTCECSIAPPWAVKCTGVSRVAVYTPVWGGTGSAGGLLTRDILRRVLPVEEGQQARRSAIMSHTSSTTRVNGFLAIATPPVEDWPREARVVKTGGDKTRCWVQMLVVVRHIHR